MNFSDVTPSFRSFALDALRGAARLDLNFVRISIFKAGLMARLGRW